MVKEVLIRARYHLLRCLLSLLLNIVKSLFRTSSTPISATSPANRRFCLPILCITSRTLQHTDKNQRGRLTTPNSHLSSVFQYGFGISDYLSSSNIQFTLDFSVPFITASHHAVSPLVYLLSLLKAYGYQIAPKTHI